jgi:PKD repeat protein
MKYFLFIILLVVVLLISGCVSENKNTVVTPSPTLVTSTPTGKPIALFSAIPLSGKPPLTVEFINLATNAETYLWDFGDGSTSSLAKPTHTYTNLGKYAVTLTVTNSVGSDITKVESFITVTNRLTQINSPTQVKNNAQNISYDDLFRYNEKYIGDIVYFRGKIIQVMPVSDGAADEYFFRVATKKSEYSGYANDIIFVYYKGSRFLEGDTIDLWARVVGLRTYTALMGNEVTVPELDALNVELVSKASGTYAEASSTISLNPQEMLKDVTHASVYITTKNWDADAADDGIIIYPELLDGSDQTVEFSGITLPVDIEIWTTKLDKNYKKINDQMVYKGRSSIDSSDDGNSWMGGGIRVPFESIAQIPNKNYGRAIIKINAPNGKIYEAQDDYTPISP